MSFPTPTTDSVDYLKVYEPAEDSFLFLDMLEKDAPFIHETFGYTTCKGATSTPKESIKSLPIVLEVGTGSGIVTAFMQQNILPRSSAIYLTTDLNLHACEVALKTSKENGGCQFMESIRASLATNIRPGLVDILLFNPPYVPDEIVPEIPNTEDDNTWLDLALLGGKDGMEVTWKLLDRLDTTLSSNGMAYLIFCKRNKPEQVAKLLEKRGWSAKQIGERKAGWEVLSVWRFTRK